MAKETTTIIKKIIPYLTKLGYSYQDEMFFEESIKSENKITGFTDIEVRINKKLMFLLEAKRDSQKINDKHRQQALDYGKARKVPFVIVTNGQTFEMLNVVTRKDIKINGISNIMPAKNNLPIILKALNKNPNINDISITSTGLDLIQYTPGGYSRQFRPAFLCHPANDSRNIRTPFLQYPASILILSGQGPAPHAWSLT